MWNKRTLSWELKWLQCCLNLSLNYVSSYYQPKDFSCCLLWVVEICSAVSCSKADSVHVDKHYLIHLFCWYDCCSLGLLMLNKWHGWCFWIHTKFVLKVVYGKKFVLRLCEFEPVLLVFFRVQWLITGCNFFSHLQLQLLIS